MTVEMESPILHMYVCMVEFYGLPQRVASAAPKAEGTVHVIFNGAPACTYHVPEITQAPGSHFLPPRFCVVRTEERRAYELFAGVYRRSTLSH